MSRDTRAARQEVTAVLDAIRLIVRELRRSSRIAEHELGLSGAQLFVLQRLSAAPATSLNDLAERTFTHQSSVSVVVNRLVTRGLVARKPSRDDKRRVSLALTAAGRALVGRAPAMAQAHLVQAVSTLSTAEIRRLGSLLDSVVIAMGAQGGRAPMIFEDERPAARAPRRAVRAPRSVGASVR